MKIWVCATMRDEEAILPFWLRHYEQFAHRMLVFDDSSVDRTKALLTAHPKVIWMRYPYETGMNEDYMLKLAHDSVKELKRQADWVIWVDADEFVHSENIQMHLSEADKRGIPILQPQGFQMAHDGFPADDGKSQIWELIRTGFPDDVYSKPIIVRGGLELLWVRGKHILDTGLMKDKTPRHEKCPHIKLLHYRYLGEHYTRLRHAKNWKHTGGDYGSAWAVRPFDDTPDRQYAPKWAGYAITINHPQIV